MKTPQQTELKLQMQLLLISTSTVQLLILVLQLLSICQQQQSDCFHVCDLSGALISGISTCCSLGQEVVMLKFKMHVLFSSFVPYLLSGRAVTYIRVTGNQTGCCTIHRIHKMATKPRLFPLVDKGPLPLRI